MMIWLRTFQLGVKSLMLHPLRSLLTVLGIFIGVASVIWLLAIGEGISIEAQRQIADLGAENIIVRSVKPPSEATADASGPVPYGLLRDEYDKLIETIPTIKSALPIRELRRQFRNGPRLVDGRLVGCTPEYAEVTRLVVDRGHFITHTELDQQSNHCVLAAEVAERLFPLQNPVGRRIHLDDDQAYYLVVGVPQTSQRDRLHRWLAGRTIVLVRCLHSHQHPAAADRRFRRHAPQRHVRRRDCRAESDYAARRQHWPGDADGRRGACVA